MPHTVSTDILFYAFRYALGRMTFAPSDVVKHLEAEWPRIDQNHRRLIQKEIQEMDDRGGLGMDCDVAQWQKIMKLPIED